MSDVTIRAGADVGDCPNCGHIAGENLAPDFPAPPECPGCGGVLEKVVVLDEPVTAPEGEVLVADEGALA